jgi:FixJ family two-component response regulator
MLEAMGIGAFAERARRELAAAGEAARKPIVEPVVELTAQEAQVAELARDGLSNPEIGARLFISARTVQNNWARCSPSSASTREASSTASCPVTGPSSCGVDVAVQFHS